MEERKGIEVLYGGDLLTCCLGGSIGFDRSELYQGEDEECTVHRHFSEE